jgi:superfamily II DNA or RNA helicase
METKLSEEIFTTAMATRLSQLNPVNRVARNGTTADGDFVFQITVAEGHDGSQKEAYLTVVNAQGKSCNPDRNRVSGAAARVLDAIADIRSQAGFQLGWNDVDDTLSLSRYPMLGSLLLDCHNIVVKGVGQVNVRIDPATVALKLQRVAGDDGATRWFQPVLGVSVFADSDESVASNADNAVGEVAAVETEDDGEEFHPLTMDKLLSRHMVLDGTSLRSVGDMGENFGIVSVFLERVPADGLNQWLSLFFTYIDNVDVVLDGSRVEWGHHDAGSEPAIVFLGVDSDRSLQLEVAHVLPGIDYNLQRSVKLTAVAVENADGRPIICRTRTEANNAMTLDADKIDELLRTYATSRKSYKEVYRDNTYFIIPPDLAGPFLLHGLPTLLRDFRLIGAEQLREYKIQPAYPRMHMRIGSGIDFLDTNVDVNIGDEKITLPELLSQYKKQRYVVLSDGNRAILDDKYMRRLQRIFKVEGSGAKAKVKVSYFDIPEIESLLNERLEGVAPERYRNFLEGFAELADMEVALPRLNATLRPYQYEGVKWMKYLHDNGMGGCLADDMGLGKTVQTIAMLTLVYGGRTRKGGTKALPSLLVMPKSLIFNWESEIARFAPWLKVYTYYAGARSMEDARNADVVLTTYGMMRNDIDTMRKYEWEYIILDESQNIKNIDSLTAKSSFLLKGKYRLALSGTPMENNIMELYSLFRFLNPAMLGDEADFNRRYAVPIQSEADTDAMSALRRKIYPFMLRRLKRDVLKDLPDLTEQTLYTEMEPEHARIYEERRKYYQSVINKSIADDGVQKSQFVIFQALSELRRIASVPESLTDSTVTSPKLDPLVETIAEATANGHKCVVFFNFIAGIELVGDRLEHLGIDYATMTGSTGDRRSVVRRFQTDADCRVLLLTLKVGGVGLNLTAADTVFIYEPWWNRAAEKQAIDRLHRIGQKMKVSSFSMITRGTIEERIRQLQEQKGELFEGIISSDSTLSKQISQEDIDFILS